jgi:Tfp pilus assembly protein PilV
MARRASAVRGVSLIEAVVALAVVGFGLLGFVGLQSALRFNGDVAKQRSEAVRIAQEAIERWRAYATVDADGALADYAEIATVAQTSVAGATTNTTFKLTRTVTDETTGDGGLNPAEPRRKTVVVDVAWEDRNGDTQNVRLSTTIAAVPPEIAGTLSLPDAGTPTRMPRARHPAVPVVAKDIGDGRSAFKPPGAPGGLVAWVFDNATGMVVGVCTNVATAQGSLTAADVSSCSGNALGYPLSGFVRFATGSTQPTAADAENPTGTGLALQIELHDLTSEGNPDPTFACYAGAPQTAIGAGDYVRYFCAVFFPVGTEEPVWSGISQVVPAGATPWVVAADAADAAVDRYKVCRYTPAASDDVSVPNRLHPRRYVDVGEVVDGAIAAPLTNQNFLVIRAGDGTTPFQCPSDVAADPATGDFVNSNTLLHQPAPTGP